MDINKLEVFLRAVENGSFFKTAQDLTYTQSGITHMMNSLESELGFSLFIRTNKGIRPTAEAQRILPLVRQLRSIHETLQQECELILRGRSGNIRVAAFSSIAVEWIPLIVKRFKQSLPDVNVEILEVSDAVEMEKWTASGFVDLCFFSLESKYTFDMIPLVDDPMLVILSKEHPLAALPEIPLEALRNESFLVASYPSGLDKDIMQVLSAAPFTPRIDCTSNLDYSIISMVACNLGVSIMPALMVKYRMGDVAARPLSPPVFRHLGIATCSLKDLSPAAKHFIVCTKEILQILEANRIKF